MRGSRTVGVLYPGEMGASLGRLLAARGVRVVTTLEHRSARTARQCRAAGLSVLGTLRDVVREADVVISLVPPAAAREVALAYRELAPLSPPSALYVDANSIAPELAASLAADLARHGRDFVDASLHGLAANLATGATLYLSGKRAPEIAALADGALRVRVLGREPGRASLMKMLLGGLSKGMCTLFLELATLAKQRGILPEMLESCASFYPELAATMERILPTCPRHAVRRVGELHELERTARVSDLDPCLIGAVRLVYEQLACVPFGEPPDANGWTVASLVEHLVASRFLCSGRVAVTASEHLQPTTARG